MKCCTKGTSRVTSCRFAAVPLQRRTLEIGHFGWVGRTFPAFPRRGGCAHQRFQKCAQTGRLVTSRSILRDFREALLMESRRLRVCLPTAPSAPLRMLRDILLIAQPPRLRNAGNGLSQYPFLVGQNGPIYSVPLAKGDSREVAGGKSSVQADEA
jgi:hypothetical protein